jgi:hypothetical protein
MTSYIFPSDHRTASPLKASPKGEGFHPSPRTDTKHHRNHRTLMPCKSRQELSGGCIPQPNVGVGCRGDACTIRAIGHGHHPPFMPLHHHQQLARCCVPLANRLVVRSRDNTCTIWTESYAIDPAIVSLQRNLASIDLLVEVEPLPATQLWGTLRQSMLGCSHFTEPRARTSCRHIGNVALPNRFLT